MIRLALLLLLVSGVARAEFQNPNVLPFGEQEAYLGNAGIALHGSAGAVYYNPGALGFVTDRTASIYGNAYAFNNYSNRIPMGVGNPDAVVNSNSYSGVPLSSVTVFGGAPWSYALSVNMPYSLQTSISTRLGLGASNVNIRYDLSEGSLWLGPTVARKFSEKFAVGASLFAARFFSHTNFVVNSVSSSFSELSAAHVNLNHWGLLLVLGAQYRPNEDWNFGLRVQTPSLGLRGRIDYYSVDQKSTGPQAVIDEEGAHAVVNRPFQFGLGTKYSLGTGSFLLFDLSAQLPVHFYSVPSRPAINSHIDTELRARGSLGAKIRLDPAHSLLSGITYNPSTLPNRESSTNLMDTREDFRGITLGLQKEIGNLATNAGGFFLWAKSETPIPGKGQVATYRHQVYGLLLTASYKL